MTWTFTEQLRYLIETGLIDGKDVKYTNQTLINGFLFSKPREKVINENTGKRVMTFYLLQIHPNGAYSFYPCRTYSLKVQDKIREQTKICFVNVEGQLMYREKTEYVLQVMSIEISHVFPDMPINPPYERNDFNAKNNDK